MTLALVFFYFENYLNSVLEKIIYYNTSKIVITVKDVMLWLMTQTCGQ